MNIAAILQRSWIVAMLLLPAAAAAQQPPVSHPASERHDIVLQFDRSAAPADQWLWAPRSILAYSPDPGLRYGQLHLTCRSSTDPVNGLCPTSGTPAPPGTGSIALQFVERRSGLSMQLPLQGALERIEASRACHSDYWNGFDYPPWSMATVQCGPLLVAGTAMRLKLGAAELARLVAGRWDATLILDLRAVPDGPVLATYRFVFDLTITDSDNVAIYFSAFHGASPVIGLDLRYRAGPPPSFSGNSRLEMCLYDGLGSQSAYLGVTLRDASGRVPGGGRFSVWHVEGGSTDTDRLDFDVALHHHGQRFPMVDGQEQRLHDIATARLQLVMLPGMTSPVYCVPTPLILETTLPDASSKRSGHYHGNLQVELRIPTTRP